MVAQVVEGAKCNDRWRSVVGTLGRRQGAAAWHRPGSATEEKQEKQIFVRRQHGTLLGSGYPTSSAAGIGLAAG